MVHPLDAGPLVAVTLPPGGGYRKDIDGLRALAVLAVIAFHFGFLPSGYLGVDVFFVVSGYLITDIIAREARDGRFSVLAFYMRRIRRILPLSLFVTFVALVVGMFTMLPDDMENLAQSAVATNLFANNILQALTTRNYWDVVNEYKPLMHTWSLGVEEQYYLLYPFLFLFAQGRRFRAVLPLVCVLAAVSLLLAFSSGFEEHEKFYLIFFRFWELALGGIAALLLQGRQVRHRFTAPLILALAAVLVAGVPSGSHQVTVLVAALLSVAVVASSNHDDRVAAFLLGNRVAVGVGQISFSLYMWHQVLVAFARYFWVEHPGPWHFAAIGALTFLLSIISYFLVEQPFRNRALTGTRTVLAAVGTMFVLTTGMALYVYVNAGVLRDVPELSIRKGVGVERGMHARYNHRIHDLDRDFASTDKVRVLVLGNSFARDWANVLLESRFGSGLEISYVEDPFTHAGFGARAESAHAVFYPELDSGTAEGLGLDRAKLWVVGTKNFGASSGIFYNHRGPDYHGQRVAVDSDYLRSNEALAMTWGGRFLDYFDGILDENGTVPVFTPDRLLISQDCRHLTRGGARYFAHLFDARLATIFGKVVPDSTGILHLHGTTTPRV